MFDLVDFVMDLPVDLGLVIEVIGHGRVGLRGREMGVLPAHFIDRPTVLQIIHHDLGDPDSRVSLQPSRVPVELLDMGVLECDGHGRRFRSWGLLERFSGSSWRYEGPC